MKPYGKQQILLLILFLTSCSQAEDITSPEYLGKTNAKSMSAEVHEAYLQCYSLNEQEKASCLIELSAKYIDKAKLQDAEYVQAFQFEAEKLGFKHFLNNHKLECEAVDGGPIFDENQKAFIVTCKPSGQYRMQFNSVTKQWSLLK